MLDSGLGFWRGSLIMDQLRVFGPPPSMPSGSFGPFPDALGPNERDGSISRLLSSSGVSGCSY